MTGFAESLLAPGSPTLLECVRVCVCIGVAGEVGVDLVLVVRRGNSSLLTSHQTPVNSSRGESDRSLIFTGLSEEGNVTGK